MYIIYVVNIGAVFVYQIITNFGTKNKLRIKYNSKAPKHTCDADRWSLRFLY